jgi:hypothetical protein
LVKGSFLVALASLTKRKLDVVILGQGERFGITHIR